MSDRTYNRFAYFEIVGEVERIETIAVGGRFRDIMRLRRKFGLGVGENSKGPHE